MNCKLYYWPVPFRGNFIRVLLAEAGEKYDEATDEEIVDLMSLPLQEQPLPSMAPPFFYDGDSNIFLSQMPAIVMYLADKLNLLPDDPWRSHLCLKLLLDSNDVLIDITNWNGTAMWDRASWRQFRTERLKRWLELFEQLGQQFGLGSTSVYLLGGTQITVADLATYALWGTMTRCLPQLRADCQQQAPHIYELCQQIEQRPKVQQFVKAQLAKSDDLYCGGQIERSIRHMLEQDATNAS
ncbi:MAG: glutathione S-transferase family protein [Leptolyngbyaceae cyanobacterium]